MEEIKLGDVLRHKATGKKCVVIQLDMTYKDTYWYKEMIVVRDEDNRRRKYYKHELEPIPKNILENN